jgi:hypothetical protein
MKPEKFFNTTGPCDPEKHYMLPAEDRLVGASLGRYIKNELYWVLHAPRQTGKTTFLQGWMHEINSGEEAIACYVSAERCQGISEAEPCNRALCDAIIEYAKHFLAPEFIPPSPKSGVLSMLSEILISWSELCAPKPLVVLFDEVDVIQDHAMISFLRQLRGGFAARGIGKFPVSIALVGMRDLRDYLVKSKDGVAINPGSPFNIKQSSASLVNFNADDVINLYSQHSKATGQVFQEEAVQAIFDLTRGQPWLVNSIAQKCHWELCKDGETITLAHVRQAKEMLIRERAVHLESLAERLKDPRVHRVVEAVITGTGETILTRDDDDVRLSMDLGLVDWTSADGFVISNPLYREIIARVLSSPWHDTMPLPQFQWKNPDGTLNIKALLLEFQDFWSQYADVWEEKADYTEAFPHLLLMAFLQRVVNGGGRIEREFAAGRGRVDLAVQYGG